MTAQVSRFELSGMDEKPDFGVFVGQTICPIMVLDRDFRYVFANEAYQKALGKTEAELLGWSYFEVLPETPKREAEIRERFRQTLDGQATRLEVQPFRALDSDGREKAGHWQAMQEPIRDASGRGIYIVQRAQDVTAQVMLQRSNDLIAAELDHRVKNLVTVILATARITSTGAESVEQYTDEFCSRLESMARYYNKLSANGWKGLSFRDMFEDELAQVAGRGSGRYAVSGENITLSVKATKDGGMVIHELVANAVKYGCFSRPGGRLDIEWTIVDGKLRILWVESGLEGVTEPTKTGFGTKLLSMMPNASIRRDFRDTGLVVEYVVPVHLAVDGYEFSGETAAEAQAPS